MKKYTNKSNEIDENSLRFVMAKNELRDSYKKIEEQREERIELYKNND